MQAVHWGRSMPPSAIKNNAALTADTLKRNKKPFIDITVV